MMGLIKIAGLSAVLAAGIVAFGNLPQEAQAAPAPAAAAKVLPEAPAVLARLPEDLGSAQAKLRLRQEEAKPADACARESWPYISPACMSGEGDRPARRIRVIGSGADAGSAAEPAARPALRR